MTVSVFPRRAFVAAALSAITAASAVALGLYGGLTRPDSQSFKFSRGVTWAGQDGERIRGFLSNALEDERIHVTVLGHSGSTGDEQANFDLSVRRAEYVAVVAKDLGISSERMTVQGLGGSRPLPKVDDESDRAYQSRLSRVEIILQMRK